MLRIFEDRIFDDVVQRDVFRGLAGVLPDAAIARNVIENLHSPHAADDIPFLTLVEEQDNILIEASRCSIEAIYQPLESILLIGVAATGYHKGVGFCDEAKNLSENHGALKFGKHSFRRTALTAREFPSVKLFEKVYSILIPKLFSEVFDLLECITPTVRIHDKSGVDVEPARVFRLINVGEPHD